MNIGEDPKNLSALNIFTFIKEIYGSIKTFHRKIDDYQKDMNSNYQIITKLQHDSLHNINKNYELLEGIHTLLNDKEKIDHNLKKSLESKLGHLVSEHIDTNQKIELGIQDLSFGNILDNDYTFDDINTTLDNDISYHTSNHIISGDGGGDGDGNGDGDSDGNGNGDGDSDGEKIVIRLDELNQIKTNKNTHIKNELHHLTSLLTSDTSILNIDNQFLEDRLNDTSTTTTVTHTTTTNTNTNTNTTSTDEKKDNNGLKSRETIENLIFD